jgi:phosphoglycerate dehydrogenase-like enzyme
MEEVLRQADYLTIHLPLMPQTKWTINKDTLALMKPDAILVNTSRGGLVNSDDLAEALRNRRICAAGLDVFENESSSDKPMGFQFLDLDNVVLTSHTAVLSFGALDSMMRYSVDAVDNFLNGRPLPGLLNKADKL